MTQAIGTFGAYGRPSDDELRILELATEYRSKLCESLHERHRKITDLRNSAFPDLFAAMSEWEATKAKIWYIEKAIKKHHSDVRDRNAVTVDQESTLTALRSRRDSLVKDIRRLKSRWFAVHKAHTMWWHTLADWANVKSLEKRMAIYESIAWPEDLSDYKRVDAAKHAEAEATGKARTPLDLDGVSVEMIVAYGKILVECDTVTRRLSAHYQSLGLHSAIRAEIVEASEPKLKKDGPGMRYEYHRHPEPKDWEKLSIHFPGGVTIGEAIGGRCKSLRLTPIYTQHKASREHTVYEVEQQIGTADHPCRITYCFKAHRPLKDTDQINRWSLVIRDGKRLVIPIVKDFPPKPTGTGTFAVDLSWTRTKDGIRVCRFVGEHVNEDLVLPNWLIENRMGVTHAQREYDQRANELLASRGCTPEAGKRQGVEALRDYCHETPTDTAAFNLLDEADDSLIRARKVMQRAVRCIEKIYETVVFRVCSQHAAMVLDMIDLQRIKRYDTRDLLKVDPLPEKSREYLAAVSPGKLKALLLGYGLASGKVTGDSQEVARESDLFTSYVKGLARKTGSKPHGSTSRSQMRSGVQCGE